jgi:hypothetical protein
MSELAETPTTAPVEAPATNDQPAAAAADAPPSRSDSREQFAETAREIAAAETATEAPAEDLATAELTDAAAYYEEFTEASLLEQQPRGEGYYVDAMQEARASQTHLVEQLAAAVGANPGEVEQFLGFLDAEAESAFQQIAAEQQATAAQVEQVALEHIEELGADSGADYGLDSAETLSIARETHAEIVRRFGPEVADNLVEQIYERAASAQAAQFEQVAEHGLAVAREHAPNATRGQQVEILSLAEEIYPRRLRELNGDADAATFESFRWAAGQVGGRPRNSEQRAALYAQRHREIETLDRTREAAAPKQPAAPQPTRKQILNHYAAEARRLSKED